MSEEIILQFMAQDDISPVIQSLQSNVITSMEQIQSALSNISTGFDNATVSVNNIGNAEKVFIGNTKDSTNILNDNTKSAKSNANETKNNSNAQKEYASNTKSATQSTRESGSALENHTNIATMSAGSLMYLSGQMSTLGSRMEDAANQLNNTKIHMDQLGKMAGVTEGEMSTMITTMSNETFSNDEAIMYTKNLVQMGAETENFVEQATNIDRINDAFGLGAETTNSLVTELSVLGVDVNDIASSFNALAYANANTKGGMENFYAFLRKYDAELNQLGYDTDQTAIIISAATQKYGGGRAALTGLSEALKNAGSDTSALEQALDLKSGALSNASKETASYEGALQSLADEEMEHKTILDRIGAAWDDFALQHSKAITTGQSLLGVFGQFGSMALYGNSIREMGYAFLTWKNADGAIMNTIRRLKMFVTAQKEASAVTSAITPASASMMASGTTPVNIPKGGAVSGAGKNASKVAKETQQVVKGAGAVGSLAPEATVAAGEMTATSGALAGISSAFTAMIVPLLAISAVIAVMIPIVAVLAAEALIFLKLIQVLIKSLGFDKIDLSKSIEGIKQIGRALLELGIAMAEMSFAALVTGLSSIVIGISQIVNPIEIAGQELLKVAEQLKVFNNVNIDENTPKKIKSITEGMKLVSEAIQELTKITMNMTWNNLLNKYLGPLKGSISQARKDIIDAGNEIAKIKNVPDLDDGALKKLQEIGSGLESMGKAFEGLRKIRDSQNFDISGWIGGVFHGVDIGQAIESVKEDIVNASTALKAFDNVDTVPENVTKSLESVANALKSVGDSITTLRKIRDDYNWDEGIGSWFADSSITKSFDALKTDLTSVASSLKGLENSVKDGGLSDISEDLPEKIQNVTGAIESVLSAIEAMEKFKGKGEGEEGTDFTNITKTIENAKTAISSVSKSLESLSGTDDKGNANLASVGEELSSRIQSINDVIKTVSTTITTITTVPKVDSESISSNIEKAVTAVGDTIDKINGLEGHKRVAEGIWTTITQTGTSAKNLGQTASSLNGLPSVNSGSIKSRASEASKAVGYAIDEINGLSGHQRPKAGIWTTIRQAGTSAQNLGRTARIMNGLPFVSSGTVKIRIKNAVDAVKAISTELKNLKSSDKVGSVKSILSSIDKAVSSLKKTLNNSSGSFKTAGHNIADGLKQGIDEGLGNLKDVVIKQVASSMEQAKSTAFTYGKGMGGRAVSGFQESFTLSQVITNELTASATAIANATPQLTSAMGSLAQQMVDAFKAQAEIASPGAIARSIRDEMGYTRGFIETRGVGVIESVGTLARNMVSNFNPNLQSSLNNIIGRLNIPSVTRSRLNAMRDIQSNVINTNNNSQRPVNINFNEGSIQVDANNLTKRESRQILINAIEGLDIIDGINVKGV